MEKALRRDRGTFAAEDVAQVVSDQLGRWAAEQLSSVLVRRLDAAVRAHEEHAVGGRFENLGQLNSLGLRFGIEAGVLQRDGRLVGEGLEQGDLLGCERARRAGAKREDADRLSLDGQGHTEDGAISGALQPKPLVLGQDETGLRQHIARPHRAALADRPPGHGSSRRQHVSTTESQARPAADPEGDERAIGVAQPEHRRLDREEGQHGLDDAIGHLAHVEVFRQRPGDARQLLGFVLPAGQIARGLAYALLQPCVRGAQLRRHLVELQRQLADLVGRLDGHAMIELTPAEPLHAQAQPLEWPGQASAEHVTRGGADQDSGHGEPREEPELAPDRGGHHGSRVLDGHAPADAVHAQARRHRVDAALVRVGSGDPGRPVLLDEAPDEGPIRQGQPLEDQVRVVGGDEPAAAIDDVGASALAELDLGDQRPEVLEVQDAHHEYPALRGAGERGDQGHPRFRRLGGRDRAPRDATNLRRDIDRGRRGGRQVGRHLATREAIAPLAPGVEDPDLLEGLLALEKSLGHECDVGRVAVQDGGAKQLCHRPQPFLLVREEQVDLVAHAAHRDQLELGPRLVNVPQRARQPDQVDAHDRDDARRRQQEKESPTQGAEAMADRGPHRSA